MHQKRSLKVLYALPEAQEEDRPDTKERFRVKIKMSTYKELRRIANDRGCSIVSLVEEILNPKENLSE